MKFPSIVLDNSPNALSQKYKTGYEQLKLLYAKAATEFDMSIIVSLQKQNQAVAAHPSYNIAARVKADGRDISDYQTMPYNLYTSISSGAAPIQVHMYKPLCSPELIKEVADELTRLHKMRIAFIKSLQSFHARVQSAATNALSDKNVNTASTGTISEERLLAGPNGKKFTNPTYDANPELCIKGVITDVKLSSQRRVQVASINEALVAAGMPPVTLYYSIKTSKVDSTIIMTSGDSPASVVWKITSEDIGTRYEPNIKTTSLLWITSVTDKRPLTVRTLLRMSVSEQVQELQKYANS